MQEFHFLYIFYFLVFRNLANLCFKFWLDVVPTTRTEESYLLLLVQIILVEVIAKASVRSGFEFQLDQVGVQILETGLAVLVHVFTNVV